MYESGAGPEGPAPLFATPCRSLAHRRCEVAGTSTEQAASGAPAAGRGDPPQRVPVLPGSSRLCRLDACRTTDRRRAGGRWLAPGPG